MKSAETPQCALIIFGVEGEVSISFRRKTHVAWPAGAALAVVENGPMRLVWHRPTSSETSSPSSSPSVA